MRVLAAAGVCVCSDDAYDRNQQCTAKIPLGEGCTASDVCRDDFATCQQGLCKCLAGYANVDAVCVATGSDGRLDGRCLNGQRCLDANTFCSQGRCKCLSNYFDKNSVCVPKIELNRPCSAGEVCRDDGALCLSGLCRCDEDYYDVNGVCRARGTLNAPCLPGNTCSDNLLVCSSSRDGRDLCLCRDGFQESGATCVPTDGGGGSTTSAPSVNIPLYGACALSDTCIDPNAVCVNGTCLCYTPFVAMDGVCVAKGSLGSSCRYGRFCEDRNARCDALGCSCRNSFFEQ